MFKITLLTAGLLIGAASGAQAACYVEFKAKRDNPLELFFQVVTISEPCTHASARAQLAPMLAQQGMTLLKIMSVRKQ